MKTTKRIFVLLCLMVVTMGAWADPTMKLTVKDGNTVIVDAVVMTLTSENHWSFSYVIPEERNNKLLSFTSTYNDGSDVNSGTCYLQAPKGTTVTFYAKYANSHALVSCDAMDHCFCDASWCLLGTIKSSIGNVSSSVLFNYYKAQACQQLANTSNSDGTYFLTRGAGNKKMNGCVIKLGENLYYVDKPNITAPTGIYKATLTYAECQIELEKITTFPLTIGDAEATTLSLPYEVTLPEELTAYTLTYNNSTTLIATKDADNVIPANTPILVNGPAGSYNIALGEGAGTYTTETIDGKAFVKDIEPDNGVNVLHGVLAPHYVRTTGVNYVLQNNGGNVGFYQVEGDTYVINPFRAFINLESAPTEARSLSIVFDDGETTGIADVRGQKEDVRSDIFNLSGQRVGKDYKGVVIKNGRKMIQK